MTGKLIFKMELVKFLAEKKYMIAVGILALVNSLLALYGVILFTYVGHLGADNLLIRLAPIVGILTFITVLANVVFVFLIPFHVLSIDYKNNVMAMMIASGVNRTKLFMSKIGAVCLVTVCLTIILGLGPFSIFFFKSLSYYSINDFFENIIAFFGSFQVNFSFVSFFIAVILNSINSVIIMTVATILMKGKNSSIFVFIGLTLLNNTATGMFSTFAFSSDVSSELIPLIQSAASIVSIVLFTFIGLHTLQKQDL